MARPQQMFIVHPRVRIIASGEDNRFQIRDYSTVRQLAIFQKSGSQELAPTFSAESRLPKA
jgi:hypothetical protein